MKRILGVVLVALGVSPTMALAQLVGHQPSSSPYYDLPYKQEFTLYGGEFYGRTGRAGVAPGQAPLIGFRYGLRLGGPVDFFTQIARTFSNRTVLDPADTGAARVVGTESTPVYLANVGLGFNLTGQKSYHHFVPVVNAGLGVASDGGKADDVGGFSLGTPFALNFGVGLRWAPRGHYQVRAEFTDYLYALKYPPLYFQAPTSTSTSVLPLDASRKQWTHNPVLSLGLSYVY